MHIKRQIRRLFGSLRLPKNADVNTGHTNNTLSGKVKQLSFRSLRGKKSNKISSESKWVLVDSSVLNVSNCDNDNNLPSYHMSRIECDTFNDNKTNSSCNGDDNEKSHYNVGDNSELEVKAQDNLLNFPSDKISLVVQVQLHNSNNDDDDYYSDYTNSVKERTLKENELLVVHLLDYEKEHGQEEESKCPLSTGDDSLTNSSPSLHHYNTTTSNSKNGSISQASLDRIYVDGTNSSKDYYVSSSSGHSQRQEKGKDANSVLNVRNEKSDTQEGKEISKSKVKRKLVLKALKKSGKEMRKALKVGFIAVGKNMMHASRAMPAPFESVPSFNYYQSGSTYDYYNDYYNYSLDEEYRYRHRRQHGRSYS